MPLPPPLALWRRCPLWTLPLGLTRGLIGSRMSRSFSTAAARTNPPWRYGISKTVPLAHVFWYSQIGRMVMACRRTSGGITSAYGITIHRCICPLPVMAVEPRCPSSTPCHAKWADWCISGMMTWRMNGGTCAALHFLPVELNANPEYFLVLVNGHGMQLAPAP